MKKLLLAFTILFSTAMIAQDTTKSVLTPYVATGISIPNTNDFTAASYVSAEIGVMIDNVSVAGVFGVNNLESFSGGLDNYWYEGKVAYAFPLGYVDGYGVFGLGTYIGTKGSLFLEYGGGISKSFGDVGSFAQVSSWDNITYFTIGLSYSF